jgi:Fe2+ or Zn2+ uptake regulation protein
MRGAAHKLLQSHGLRITMPRLILLDAVLSQGPRTVDELVRNLLRDGRSISLTAGYRILGELEAAGILRKEWVVTFGVGRVAYSIRTPDAAEPPHSLICRRCKSRTPFNYPRLLSHLQEETGMTPLGLDQPLEIYFICQKCRNAS